MNTALHSSCVMSPESTQSALYTTPDLIVPRSDCIMSSASITGVNSTRPIHGNNKDPLKESTVTAFT